MSFLFATFYRRVGFVVVTTALIILFCLAFALFLDRSQPQKQISVVVVRGTTFTEAARTARTGGHCPSMGVAALGTALSSTG